MVSNIKEIKIWENNPKANNNVPIVKIEFNFPCSWTTLNINDLKQILREWIKGEEMKYPKEKGFQGRWMLYDEIKKVFNE